MTAIALVTADTVHVVRSDEQHTLIAAAAITAGQAVHQDANGKWAVVDSDAAGIGPDFWGIATATVPAGMPVTAIKRGLMDGFDLSGLAYGALVYTSVTPGNLDTATATGAIPIGRVLAALAQSVGVAPDKILEIGL